MVNAILFEQNSRIAYGADRLMRKVFFCCLLAVLFANQLSAQTINILAFGDSLTAGFGLPEEDGFTKQLEGTLIEGGEDVKIINAGVSGDTTAGGAARIEWSATPDIDAVILELGANDILRGLPPENARANLDKIMRVLTDKGIPVLIAGIPAPPNYGGAYQVEFNRIYPSLSEEYAALYYPNFLAGLGDTIPEIRKLMQADGLHPNKDGVGRIVADIAPLVIELANRAR